MIFENIFIKLITELNEINDNKIKPIADAIKNRNPISFYYSGPTKPEEKRVLAGKRFKVEAVALGPHKNSNNLVIRGYVQPPSVSKKGFNEHNWRTFLIDRMTDIEIHKDETFNIKRPLYKDGDDGSMSTTYVKSQWTSTPEIKKKEEPLPQPKEKTIQKTPEQLPQPKSKEKPPATPEFVSKSKFDVEVYGSLKSKIKDIDGKKTVSTIDYENSLKELYKKKEKEWIENQKSIGGNIKPGEGTRERFRKESKNEIDKLMNNDKVEISDENTNLTESINRIKSLIFY